MALRIIEMVLTRHDGAELLELLKDQKLLEHRQIRLADGDVLVRILLEAGQSEAVLDLLEERFVGKIGNEGNRVVIMPVEATLPRSELEPRATPEQALSVQKSPERISREELYEDIKNGASCSRVYLMMVVLSTIVAIVGMHQNSATVIIGAMVIAPHLGPNVALALATALGDLPLARHALITNLNGIAVTAVLSVIIGALMNVDPTLSEVALRTNVGFGDIALALASGCAGAMAFTTGVSTTLIGVMVAVALLPPLVAFGLLLGGWHPGLAMGALALFLVNLICVNLSGVVTFLVQGIHPATWWEKDQAEKAIYTAIRLWAVLLLILIGLILIFQ